MTSPRTPYVPLGRIVATPAALAAVSPPDIAAALRRHTSGDWGEVDPDDRAANDDAVRSGERLLSVYRSAGGTTFWALTEADRSATTVLLPADY
jgi:hypothetical protein